MRKCKCGNDGARNAKFCLRCGTVYSSQQRRPAPHFSDSAALQIGVVEQMAEARERIILVVDDNADHRKGFRILLESAGYFVTECSSGKEALTALETISVDLMTVDLSMPDVDGFDVLQAARSKHPELKIVVVSGFLQGSMNAAAKKLGATVTLDKNLAADLLLPMVRDLLNPTCVSRTTEPVQIKSQTTKAVSAHVLWTAKLKAAIQSGESSYLLPEVEADDQCELGRWLKSPISPGLHNSPHYAKTLELHHQFHREAGRILRLAIDGKSAEALKAMEANGDITKACSSLVSELRAWNQAIVA
jgi:CheY-like chemotaxis protein